MSRKIIKRDFEDMKDRMRWTDAELGEFAQEANVLRAGFC